MNEHILDLLHQAFHAHLFRDGLPRHADGRIAEPLFQARVLRAHHRDRGQGRGIGIDQRAPVLAALPVIFRACRGIIGAVDRHRDTREDLRQPLGPFPAQHLDPDFGIDFQRQPRRRLRLVLADGIGAGEQLAVEVRHLETVKIGDDEAAHARTQQRHEGRAAHAADTGNEDAGLAQACLFGLGHETAIAGGHFGVAEGGHGRGLRRL